MSNGFRKTVRAGMLILGMMAGPMVSAQESDVPRKVTKRVTPVYPPIALRARMSGTVKLVVVVTPEGTVKTVKTLGGNAVLAQAAEEATRQWKFEAAKNESSVILALKFDAPE
jgi:protein TonB